MTKLDRTRPPVLSITGLTKRFPGVLALDGVDLEIFGGEVHALFGENGAGKSTLISILSGAQTPDAGIIELERVPIHLASVAKARQIGISAVFQEFSLAPALPVDLNLVLGDEPAIGPFLSHKAVRREAVRRLEEFGFVIDPARLVETLSRAEQQMVEIAKAYHPNLRVLILDEPTASLTDQEAERLFELIGQAKARGLAIIYITHRIAEIERLADRITVLRDGRKIATVPGSTSHDELVQLMTGREVGTLYPELPEPGTQVVLEATGVRTDDGLANGVDFTVKAGEIVSFAGLVGAGKSSAARACFGAEQLLGGRIEVNGTNLAGKTPRGFLKAGVVYLPSDRKAEGLFLNRGLRESVTLPWLKRVATTKLGTLALRKEKDVAIDMLNRMELSPPDPERTAASYSGGNQQKALLGRALLGECVVYIFDEPTVGVDVGARVAIYRQIVDLARHGNAVLLISSELDEVLGLSHRSYVFSGGRIVAEIPRSELNEEVVLRHMIQLGTTAGSEAGAMPDSKTNVENTNE